MQFRSLEQETWLEIGLSVLAVSILGGVVMLLYGRASGSAHQGRQRARGAPVFGSVPYERHQNIGAVSTR